MPALGFEVSFSKSVSKAATLRGMPGLLTPNNPGTGIMAWQAGVVREGGWLLWAEPGLGRLGEAGRLRMSYQRESEAPSGIHASIPRHFSNLSSVSLTLSLKHSAASWGLLLLYALMLFGSQFARHPRLGMAPQVSNS